MFGVWIADAYKNYDAQRFLYYLRSAYASVEAKVLVPREEAGRSLSFVLSICTGRPLWRRSTFFSHGQLTVVGEPANAAKVGAVSMPS